MNSLLLCVVTLFTVTVCIQLPPNFKKCNMRTSNFNECLGDAIHDAIKKLDRPLKSHGIASLYDVGFREQDVIEFGTKSLSGLRQKFSKFRIIGLSKPEQTTARLDFENGTYALTLVNTYPDLVFKAEYEGEGAVVMMPLNVVTPVEVILDNPTMTLTFELDPYERDTTYFRLINTTVDLTTHGMRWNFKHLFQNKLLNDEFNAEMTKKGMRIFALYKYLQVTFAPYFGLVFNDLLKKVSAAELFDGF